MATLDLVKVYTPSGELTRIKRTDLQKALSRGYKEADVPKKEEEPTFLEEAGETAADTGRAALSGLTMGGLEELIAGGKAITSSEKEDLATLYRKYLDIEEKKSEEMRQRSPTASLIGEVGGALAPALFTGGTGLLASGGRAAARLGAKELAKAALKGAAVGAAGGAISGGLTSKEGRLIGGSEEERAKLAEDIVSGGELGGVLGGVASAAIPTLGKGVSAAKGKASEALEGTLFGKHLKKAFEMGERGESVLTGEGAKKAMLKEGEQANKLTTELLKVEDAAANEFKDPLKFATEAGKKVSLVTEDSQEIIDAMQKAGAPSKFIAKTRGLLSPATEKSSGIMGQEAATNLLSPYEAYEFRKQLQEEAAKRPELKGVFGNIINHIDEKIESVFDDPTIKKNLADAGLPTSYKEGLNSYRNFVSSGIESIMEEGRPGKQILTAEQEAARKAGAVVEEPTTAAARGTRFRDLQFPEKELQKKVSGIVETLNLPSEARKEAVLSLYGEGGFVPMLKELSEKKPEAAMRIAKGAGFSSPDELIKHITGKFEEQSMESAVRRIVSGVDTTEAVTPRKILSEGGLGALTRRGGTSLSMSVGSGKRAIGGVLEKAAETMPVKISKSLYNLPDDSIRKLATQLQGSGNKTFMGFGENLIKALDNGDSVKKQAILFSLLQNPSFRESFK